MSKSSGGIQLKLGQLKLKSSKPKAQEDNKNNNLNTSSPAISNYFDHTSPSTSRTLQTRELFSSPKTNTECTLAEKIRAKRLRNFQSVLSTPFNTRRTRILSQTKTLPPNSNGILYWMSREQRVQGLFSVYT
jgi:hypothetical protein